MRSDIQVLIEGLERDLDSLAGLAGREAQIHARLGQIVGLREALKYVKPQESK